MEAFKIKFKKNFFIVIFASLIILVSGLSHIKTEASELLQIPLDQEINDIHSIFQYGNKTFIIRTKPSENGYAKHIEILVRDGSNTSSIFTSNPIYLGIHSFILTYDLGKEIKIIVTGSGSVTGFLIDKDNYDTKAYDSSVESSFLKPFQEIIKDTEYSDMELYQINGIISWAIGKRGGGETILVHKDGNYKYFPSLDGRISPLGNYAFDNEGNIYVNNLLNHTILKLDSFGDITEFTLPGDVNLIGYKRFPDEQYGWILKQGIYASRNNHLYFYYYNNNNSYDLEFYQGLGVFKLVDGRVELIKTIDDDSLGIDASELQTDVNGHVWYKRNIDSKFVYGYFDNTLNMNDKFTINSGEAPKGFDVYDDELVIYNENKFGVSSNAVAISTKTGWLNENGNWYYYNSDGNKKTGWLFDRGAWYFFNPSGEMKTGWLFNGGAWYFFNQSGEMKTGWSFNGGAWYFFNQNGEMKTGWLFDRGVWYYLNQTGSMKTGWLYHGNNWYYMSRTGQMTTGWNLVNKKWYYFQPSGQMTINTWISNKYWIDGNGVWTKTR